MADTLCDDRPLAFDDLVEWFDQGSKPASEFKVGAEHEKFVFRLGGHEFAILLPETTVDAAESPEGGTQPKRTQRMRRVENARKILV